MIAAIIISWAFAIYMIHCAAKDYGLRREAEHEASLARAALAAALAQATLLEMRTQRDHESHDERRSQEREAKLRGDR